MPLLVSIGQGELLVHATGNLQGMDAIVGFHRDDLCHLCSFENDIFRRSREMEKEE